ncbi:uncharacterized protein UTRI_04248_B [Ustilago trichophora]|uniref:Uncharacterized protein n=1 Tax=Ustilago trichophora TaxID=86804 RepID=A0A5C3EDK8_9BASI|nr:uncharacterized protein UTRI_04248_B [Ustilago trichophora]
MQSLSRNNTMIDSEPPAKKPRGRPRKVDTSQPLHPWASTSRPQQQQQQIPSPSISHHSLTRATVHPQQLPTGTNLPLQAAAAAIAPVPTASFYAQPQAQAQPQLQPQPQPYVSTAAYVRATPVPAAIPEQQYVVPVPMPRQNVPTRADLEFLLGGPPRVKVRSATPNVAATQTRQVSNSSAAPVSAAVARSTPSGQYQYPPIVQMPVAGPSRTTAPSPTAHAVYPQTTNHPNRTAVSSRPANLAVFPGDEEPDRSAEYDDGLALGAEAVMESDHDGDIEDEIQFQETDDPNDPDFRPNAAASKRPSRPSQTSEGAASTPPRTGRRSLASSSTGVGKVAGSSAAADGVTKRRGRPPKVFYTPDVVEKMKIANEILNMAEEAGALGGKARLDDIIDRKTRAQLSPEMQAAILRARNTQLQRVRRERLLRNEPVLGLNKRRKVQGEDKPEVKDKGEKKRGRPRSSVDKRDGEDKEVDAEGGSGSAIVERARGKVAEWIKTISSEAGGSEDATPAGDASFHEDEESGQGQRTKRTDGRSSAVAAPESSASSRKRTSKAGATSPPPSTPPAPAPAIAVPETEPAGDASIDPRVEGPADGEEHAVEHYFSRFGKVTGKETPASPPAAAAAAAAAAAGAAPSNTERAVEAGQLYEAGVVGDEYYFST